MDKTALLTFNPELKHKWRAVLDQVLSWNKWDTEDELAWLCEAASMSKQILELGSYCGVSTKVMALANPAAKIRAIDLWHDAGTHEEFCGRLKGEIAAGQVTFDQMKTSDGILKVSKQLPRFDMVFIDAGHTYEFVHSDIVMTLPLLTKNAILSGHDYRVNLPEDGVTKAVCELVPTHKVVADSIWAAVV